MLDVIMTCYFPPDAPQRRDYAVKSLDSLISNLIAEELRLVIADDSSYEDSIVTVLKTKSVIHWETDTLHTQSRHRGIGASLNLALRSSDSELWMYTTDDWLLTKPLDLTGPTMLLKGGGYDLVRLGPIHPDLQCVTRFQQGVGWWLDLRQEYGGFAFATRPFVATKAWYDRMGPFDEGLNSYETERLYAERVARSTSKLAYWGGIDLAGPWEHLGLVEVGYREIA